MSTTQAGVGKLAMMFLSMYNGQTKGFRAGSHSHCGPFTLLREM